MSQAAYLLAGFRTMTAGDLTGGVLTYAGSDYPCALGTFDTQQVLANGGFAPMLLGDAQVAVADLPPGTAFKAGQSITITPATGQPRACKVHSVKELGAIVSITLRDLNQGA